MLVLGLVLFLGVHSVRVVADGWRSRTIARVGEGAWKGGYTVVSLIGFALICWGYAQARQAPQVLWASPTWTRHLAGTLMLPSIVLLVAAYVPGNGLKARLGHPMLLGVKLWALAHLLANNTLADVLLFGGFGVWAVLAFRAARQRDRAQPPARVAQRSGATAVTVVAGLAVYALLVLGGHQWLIGVRPFG